MIKDALKIDRPPSIFERSPSGANPSSAFEKWGLELLPGKRKNLELLCKVDFMLVRWGGGISLKKDPLLRRER